MIHFVFQASTMDSFKEISEKRMHDLSLWMARFIALQCKVTTLVKNQGDITGEMFYYDNNSFDVKSETLGLEEANSLE